jgi:tRNA-dihydrouridine synthase B
MNIGSFTLPNKVILAPMAGITDLPFREICASMGAGLTISEMVASNPVLRHHQRTRLKATTSQNLLQVVQILGTNPQDLAQAAQFNVQHGAQMIDINMGCPAKKVCSVAAGSALLRHEVLVKNILECVVKAVPVPVTLKIRTGWDVHSRNAVQIAQIAQDAGIAALTIHGRTRACKFEGEAEYDTITTVKQAVDIPIIANGDIDSAEKAKAVLEKTGADAIMIGRAAQGNPWIFKQIYDFIAYGDITPKPSINEIYQTVTLHAEKLYRFYGEDVGVRMARKHIAWYLRLLDTHNERSFNISARQQIHQAQTPKEQLRCVQKTFDFQSNVSEIS